MAALLDGSQWSQVCMLNPGTNYQYFVKILIYQKYKMILGDLIRYR